ncbi:MAG: ACT domain-containing protein, partial [Arthrobacter oryzae]
AAALFLIAGTGDDLRPWEQARMEELEGRVRLVLAHPEVTGRTAANAVEQRRNAAGRLTADPTVRERIVAAPRAYVLATAPADLARQATLCEPPPRGDQVRVAVGPLGAGRWRVDVVAHDRIGLLSADAHALAAEGLDILEASVATWGDGCGLASFVTASLSEPDAGALEQRVRQSLRNPEPGAPLVGASVSFDTMASPWHTICRIEAPDRQGLLRAVTSALAAAGASVHSARVATVEGRAADVFELTDRNGEKLGSAMEDEIRRVLAAGAPVPRRRRASWRSARGHGRNGATSVEVSEDINTQQSGDRPEMPAS